MRLFQATSVSVDSPASRPWATLSGRVSQGVDPNTNMMTVSVKGDAEKLLDPAFRAVVTIEVAICRYEALST
jgi:hypothetical protein